MLTCLNGISFKVVLTTVNEVEVHYQIWLDDAALRAYPLEPNAVVGTAAWDDDYPLSMSVHPSLVWDDEREEKCRHLIHNAIAAWFARESSRDDIHEMTFRPRLPEYAGPGSPWFSKIMGHLCVSLS